MRLKPGTRLGNYEVIGGIGEGGMGEVYRARDTVLQREIALKLVHPDFCHHEDSLARLRREARALASLNHPNVATLHELAEFGGSCGLVMELIGGETLAAVLRRQRLNVEEALRIAAQIAAALDAAHERGVIHRDLKPANIKITAGQVKVLDFGLAKSAGDAADTASTLMTAAGAVLGTAPYMSPEQTRGEPVDGRTDIWAFGCVLFEMLTGRQAFDGGTRSDIVAAIIHKEPDYALLPAQTPESIQRLIRRCLNKDQVRRLRDIGDARLELEDATQPNPQVVDSLPASAAPRSAIRMRPFAFTAIGAVAGALASWIFLQPQSTARPADEVRFAIALADDERLTATDLRSLTIAPDGRTVVFVATRGGTTQLMARTLSSNAARALQGTVGAITPFFSPDGRWVAFFADGKLKKVQLSGGSPIEICDAPDGLGGTWSASGTIVFASATGSALQATTADGGAPKRVTELEVSRGEFSHRWPEFLPDGDTVLFTVGTVGEWDDAEIAAQSLRSGKRTMLLKGGTNPHYLDTRQLLYAHDGAIWAIMFDESQLTVSGSPARVLEGVATSADGAAQFATSVDGTAVYYASTPASSRRLVMVEGGALTPLAAPPHSYLTPRISPDGSRVLLGMADAAEHVWSYDLRQGTLTQLTFEGANRTPIWEPNGRVTFASNRNGPFNLFSVAPSAADAAERLTAADALQLSGSWSPDGHTLAFMEQHPITGRDVWLMRRDGHRTAFATSAADESAPRFSPDGRWIAYASNEAGPPNVYVRRVNDAGPSRRLSPASGSEPVWRPDGAAVYFRSEGKLFVAPLNGGSPRVAIDVETLPGTLDAASYDVVANNRFVMMTSASAGTEPSQLQMILNWRPAPVSSR
jgi:Tol biopolymer transport system component/tRNA A-37 threonylcarbamoyl transferase component Bud32